MVFILFVTIEVNSKNKKMKEIITAFNNNSIFDDFSKDELWQLAGEMDKEIYVSGENIFNVNDQANKIYILVSGHFMVHFPDNRAFTLMSPGDIIGTEPFLDKKFYLTTCTCLSLQGSCGVLTGETLLRVGTKYGSIKSKLSRLKKEFLSKTKYFKR